MRAHAELIKKWADDPDMELEYLSSCNKWEPAPSPSWDSTALYREKPKTVTKWLWVIQIGEETLLSVYFCATKEELFKRYPHEIVVISRIEDSKIEVEE